MNNLKNEHFVRPYTSGDEEEIVRLLQLALDGWPHFDLGCTPLEHWRWKYLSNPLNNGVIFLCISDSHIIGTLHSVSVRIKMKDEILFCNLGGDVAVKEEFRNKGVWKNILNASTVKRREQGVKYAYSITHNPIVVKNFTRSKEHVGFPVPLTYFVRIKDLDLHWHFKHYKKSTFTKIGFYAAKLLNHLNNILPRSEKFSQKINVSQIDVFDSRITYFWERILDHYDFILERSRDYLNWRYCDPRGGNYLVKAAEEDGQVVGYSVLRINRYQREYPVGYIIDLLTLPDRFDVAHVLVDDAVKHFHDHNINIIQYLGVKNHPYGRILKRHGFLDARTRPHIFFQKLSSKDNLSDIKKVSPSKVHFCYGDLDVI